MIMSFEQHGLDFQLQENIQSGRKERENISDKKTKQSKKKKLLAEEMSISQGELCFCRDGDETQQGRTAVGASKVSGSVVFDFKVHCPCSQAGEKCKLSK